MSKKRGSSPEEHSMRGWGRVLGDLEQPRDRDDAMLTSLLACADRLFEIGVLLQDLQNRLSRMEVWFETQAPGYRQSTAENFGQGRTPYVEPPALRSSRRE